ncbi:C-type lectin domain family 4 member D-like isoform X2 [Lacerta agilis]|uniref:C-type lectin domain family 4 member D-like isoform X2 n=1 Tax=Lacerta agilis TaxID=80427 RepID=UPI00141A210F|nr:C-type lectin domain family 4 member D-like isoform X2 [Lacerta agilis]
MARQRPDSIESLASSERDYENVIPPHLLRWQQPTAQQTQKADTGVSTPTRFTDHTYCCFRRAIVTLYILVFVSLLIASAAFVLAFLKFIPQCPGGFQKYQTKCFYISIHKHTWAEAWRNCSRRSAPLATAEAIKEVNLNLGNISKYWVDNPEGEQNKVTGRSRKTENENCTFVFWKNNMIAHSQISCTHPLHYICEKYQA